MYIYIYISFATTTVHCEGKALLSEITRSDFENDWKAPFEDPALMEKHRESEVL